MLFHQVEIFLMKASMVNIFFTFLRRGNAQCHTTNHALHAVALIKAENYIILKFHLQLQFHIQIISAIGTHNITPSLNRIILSLTTSK